MKALKPYIYIYIYDLMLSIDSDLWIMKSIDIKLIPLGLWQLKIEFEDDILMIYSLSGLMGRMNLISLLNV